VIVLGPHAGFILSAYGAALAIVLALITWVVFERRHLARMLDRLDARGLGRRGRRIGENQS
jgi:heme exporter protein D